MLPNRASGAGATAPNTDPADTFLPNGPAGPGPTSDVGSTTRPMDNRPRRFRSAYRYGNLALDLVLTLGALWIIVCLYQWARASWGPIVP